jgi:hypothetical protein
VFCAFFGKPLRRLFVDLNPLRRTCRTGAAPAGVTGRHYVAMGLVRIRYMSVP